MAIVVPRRWLGSALSLLVVSQASPLWANPTAEDALKLQPVQKDVEFDRPKETTGSSIKAEQVDGKTGWVVRDAAGTILRRFVDTNGDNLVDQWCYYSAGIEVYRDIDSNYDGKADQYRWLNTGGTRWGTDADQDGRIDQWKMISAEEVTSEVIRAIGERDANRFNRLLITADEVTSLGLGKSHSEEVTKIVGNATERFRAFLTDAKSPSATLVSTGNKLRWLQMGATLPGLLPAGSDGSTKDVMAYENVLAMVEADGKHEQIPVGTLVRVDNVWRLVDAPREAGEGGTIGVIIKGARGTAGGEGGSTGTPGTAAAPPDFAKKLEDIDNAIAKATPSDLPRLHAEKADLLEKIAEGSKDGERATWFKQMADTISVATQSGQFPEGVERLKKLAEKLLETDKEVGAIVQFRYLTANYYSEIQKPNANYPALQTAWLESLKKFVTDFPKADDVAEAILQLGIAEEFAGNEAGAKEWYGKGAAIATDVAPVKKAAGALARLNSVGKVLNLTGTTIDGKGQLNLSAYKGKIVVLHYWASWCQPFISDMPALRELQAKYAKDLVIVGANLDDNKDAALTFLKSNRLPWAHLWSEGGLDSGLANSLGVVTVPTVMLIDKQGRVVNRGISVGELDKEIGALQK
ncbi:MAG: TlpA family protein disulfide reductase [Planctomycetaceae bacterium]|nr:TlpA family protein disulfide reductase [Planctomycetaceae bacterium]